MTTRVLVALSLALSLAACGDKTEAKPDSSAAATATQKAASTAAATSTAAAVSTAAAKKKDDSGW